MTFADKGAVIVILGIVVVIFLAVVMQSIRLIPKKEWATFVIITLVSVFAFIIAIMFT